MRLGVWIIAAVGACSGSGPSGDGGDGGTDTDTDTDTQTDGTTPTTGETGTTPTSTGDTGPTTTEPTFDCSAPKPTNPRPFVSYDIVTTEDFDFDALGSMVYSDWVNFVAVDSYGEFSVIAPGIEDTRGIQIMSDGNIAAAYITQGRLGYTDRLTGASYTLLAGLSAPNALDIGHDDIMFVTEAGNGRVTRFDPATGEHAVIATGFTYPNGIALNQEQNRLFVADSTQGVYMLELNESTGEWGPQQLLFNPPGSESYDGIEVDYCGNVYVVQFYNGELHRFNPDTLVGELLIDLDDSQSFLWNSVRWGSNRGIWSRTTLYVTDRHKVFGVDIGIPGRDQPVDLVP
ncbi:MAG: SMP-30/gluconolactonase/LRE family protein [Myxococcota bacterium]